VESELILESVVTTGTQCGDHEVAATIRAPDYASRTSERRGQYR
jgi:hypothetical protein